MSGTVDLLRLIGGYSQEPSYTVWESIGGTLSLFSRLFSNTDFHDEFKKYAIDLLLPTIDRLGWESRDSDGE